MSGFARATPHPAARSCSVVITGIVQSPRSTCSSHGSVLAFFAGEACGDCDFAVWPYGSGSHLWSVSQGGISCFWLAPGGRQVDAVVCLIVLACPRLLGWSQPIHDLVVRGHCAGRLPGRRMRGLQGIRQVFACRLVVQARSESYPPPQGGKNAWVRLRGAEVQIGRTWMWCCTA